MKQKKGRLILLFSIIFILCIVAGYCYYRYYIDNKEETINEINEEINLGDCNSDCDRQCKSAGRGTSSYNYCYTSCMSSCKPTSCLPGSYLTNNRCKPCPAGSWCSGGKSQPTKCGNGYYSLSGASECTKCSGTTNSQKTVCYNCDFSYSKSDNKLRLSGSSTSNEPIMKMVIDGRETSVLSVKKGSHSGIVYFSSGNTCSTSYKLSGCESVIATIPPKASADSHIMVHMTLSDVDVLDGDMCTYKIIAQSDKGSVYTSPEISIKGFPRPRADVSAGIFSACSIVDVKVYYNNKIVASNYVNVETKFTEETVDRPFQPDDYIPYDTISADRANKSYYGNEKECYNNASGQRICPVHIRSRCGTVSVYNYCCVNNGILEASTDAIYKEYEPIKKCPNNYTLLENVKKADCVIKKVSGSCDTTTISPPKKSLQSNACEDTVNMSVDEGKQCTTTVNSQKNSFYEITCAKTVKTNFDYGNDGDASTIRTLHKGEGFAFGVSIDTTVNCKYTFIDENFKKAYNSVINKIKSINSNLVQYVNSNDETGWKNYIDKNILNKNGITNASELYRLWGLIEQLRGVVKAYNEYKPNDDYNESGRITVTTKENKKDVISKYELLKIVKSEGTTKTSNVKTSNLNVALVTNPKSYTLTSSTPRKVVLMPKRSCIDKNGKVMTIDGEKCPNNTLDGGNKIYINYNTDITNNQSAYSISIEVEGLGANDSKINNNKCNLKVEESKYIYRPIDVENPFISSSWKKGKNWINEKYDFTKVIHANTWSDNTNRKVITLTSKDIVSLKESNNRAWKDNNSPYLGLCYKQSEKLQDEITRKLCETIK